MKNDFMTLVSKTYEQDNNGVLRATETLKENIPCQVKSAGASEWFEGGRSGLNPQYKITMFSPDYNDEEIVELKGKQYTVYRTYHTDHGSYGYHQPSKDHIELYVQLKKGNED